MTDYNGDSLIAITIESESEQGERVADNFVNCAIDSVNLYPENSGTAEIIYYFMRGQDLDCLPTITYRTWVVQDSPDTSGSQYSGTRCGATPLSDIVVINKLIT